MDEYLYKQSLHMDFHYGLSLIFDFLKDNYGEKEVIRIMKNVASEIYSPLIKDLKKRGLKEAGDHLKKVMELEGGTYDIEQNNETLIFKVNKCPAVHHIKDTGKNISENFCRCSTEIVNSVIAEEAGYKFSIDFDQDRGACVQKFWKEDK